LPVATAHPIVLTTAESDGDAPGAGRESGVVREVVDQLTGSGRVEDDLLDAGVEAVEIEDVAGGGRVAEPLADVLDSVSGRRDRGAIWGRGEVEVDERDQAYRVQGRVLLLLAGVRGR
jgi:hypothetical protein